MTASAAASSSSTAAAPSSPIHLFVDNSNVLIEGRRFSAASKSRNKKLSTTLDQTYEMDWGKFLYLVKEKGARVLAEVPILYGSRPPPDDSVWQRIREEGFDAKVFDRNIRNKEKGVDMEMGMDIAERFAAVKPAGTMLIAAGDADYVPAVERAQSKGWTVEVWFWSNASERLRNAADRFVPLDKDLGFLRLGGKVV